MLRCFASPCRGDTRARKGGKCHLVQDTGSHSSFFRLMNTEGLLGHLASVEMKLFEMPQFYALYELKCHILYGI